MFLPYTKLPRAAPLETLAPGPSDGLAGRAHTVFRRVPLDLEVFDIQVHLGSWFEHAGPVPLSLSAPLVGMQDWISRMGVLALPRRKPPRLEDGARGDSDTTDPSIATIRSP